MGEGTELVGYATFLFFAYIYLPYAFLKFGAEQSIDLGKRRDFTQFEEIISGFVPAFVLNLLASLLYLGVTRCRYRLDFSVMASMFGSNRGAVSDYIYAGDWAGCLIYLFVLWGVAYANGYWFGAAVHEIAETNPLALHGIERVWEEWETHRRKVPATAKRNPWTRFRSGFLWLGWWLWYRFFQESIVPLYTWIAQHPIVLVETARYDRFLGRFIRYEKTTDGQFDAIRLEVASRLPSRRRASSNRKKTTPEDSKCVPIGMFYLKWSEIASIVVIGPADSENCETAIALFTWWTRNTTSMDSVTPESGGDA
ncbi:MAG TPA: hypothetical protein VNN25_15790 [Thermoanaerobaculia bacterium]|nr:hypothetical protein [Thermoanaerobaculia bacterium]